MFFGVFSQCWSEPWTVFSPMRRKSIRSGSPTRRYTGKSGGILYSQGYNYTVGWDEFHLKTYFTVGPKKMESKKKLNFAQMLQEQIMTNKMTRDRSLNLYLIVQCKIRSSFLKVFSTVICNVHQYIVKSRFFLGFFRNFLQLQY